MKTTILAGVLTLAALPLHAESATGKGPHWFTNAQVLEQREGAEIYAAVCAACHMPDGRGAQGAGAYPALAGNANLEHADYPVHVIVNGQKAMPAFGKLLDDEQVAAVVNYIRGSLGNDWTAEPATAASVAAAR